MPPTVAIVLVNWNGLADTQACLESLARLDYPQASVIVVDNGSASGQASALRSAYPGVTVLETGRNLGFAGGNNVGITYALQHSPDYVLCLNNDTLVAPDFLWPLVAALERHPDAGLASPKIFYADFPDRVWFLKGECAFDEEAVRRGIPCGHADEAALEAATEPFETAYATGCALLARASLMRRLQGFDDRYFAYCEDVDLSLRAAEQGFKSLVVPEARVWHKVSRSRGGEQAPLVVYYCVRNSLLLARTHLSGGRSAVAAYCRAFCRQQRRIVFGVSWNPRATEHEKAHARARLSAVWCVRLGAYGRRQDHPVIEATAAACVAVVGMLAQFLEKTGLRPAAKRLHGLLKARFKSSGTRPVLEMREHGIQHRH